MDESISYFWEKFFEDLPLVTAYAYVLFWEQAIKKLRDKDANIKTMEIGYKVIDQFVLELSHLPDEIGEQKIKSKRKEVYKKLVELREEDAAVRNFSRDYQVAMNYAQKWLIHFPSKEEGK